MRLKATAPVAVEVTSRCNRACTYCYNDCGPSSKGPAEELGAEELVAIVEKALAGTGRNHVQLSGGEPLVRSDLFGIIERLRRPGRTISLVTDAGLITSDVAATLRRLRVGPVQPTLLAADREVHDALKRAKSFDLTLAGIENLKRVGVPISVSFVCTRMNYSHFQAVLDLCVRLGVRNVAFSRLCIAGRAAGGTGGGGGVGGWGKAWGGEGVKLGLGEVEGAAPLAPEPDMVSKCLSAAAEANEKGAIKVHVAISLPLCLPTAEHFRHLSFGSCALSTANPGYTIDPWGRVRACSVSSVILGDLRTETWDAVISRARGDYFRSVSTPPPACSGCKLLARCRGGCRESARAAFGSPARPDPLARRRSPGAAPLRPVPDNDGRRTRG